MLPGGSKRGRQVTRFSPGDEVFGRSDGSYAEYATAGEDDFAVLDMKEPEPRPVKFRYPLDELVPVRP